ncbi:MAG TPA: hypothetical protein VGO25_00515 [Rhodanobacteraceae bacterium]|jgi:hypothetical protein|nr:hypothetical protein [Rhodanobacteraceae bacterium]
MIETTDETLRRWLLHRLPTGEAEALEQRLLTDEDFGERVRAAETDLLDDYACGDLAADERPIAAERFAATARDRLRLRIAMALARITRRSPRKLAGSRHHRHAGAATGAGSRRRTRVRRIAAIGLAASACALVVAVIGLNQRMTSLAPPSTQAETTITLLADSQRGANIQRIALPASAATVRLQAEVDQSDVDRRDSRARYTLSIDDAGRTVFSAEHIGVREAGPYRFVEVVFDAQTLAAGTHRVRVIAEGSAEPAATWTLEISTK